MARPIKKGLEYFPFDVGFFSDKKVKILKSRYGADGIVIYQYLLCEIYKENGYFLIVDEDFEYIISDDLNMESNKVKQVLNFLLERSLFDSKLFQSDKVLTSAGIQKRYQEAVKTRASKKAIIVGKYWLLKEEETASYIKVTLFEDKSENNCGKSEINSSLSVEKIHKEKESKVNKSKEKKSSGFFSDEKLNELFEQYLIMREKKGKPVVGYQLKILIDRLNQVAVNTKEKIEVVSNAIAGDWNTFYPIKRNTKKNTFAAFAKREYDHDALEKQAMLLNQKMFDDMKKGKTNEQI